MPLEPQHKEILFDTGIDDSSDPAANEAGLDDIVNLEFHRDDSLTRRPGFTRVDAANTIPTNAGGTLVGAPGGGPVALMGEWKATLGIQSINTLTTASPGVQDALHAHVTRAGYSASGESFATPAVAASSVNPAFVGIAARNSDAGTVVVRFFRNGDPYSGAVASLAATEFRFVATPSAFILLFRRSSDSKVYGMAWSGSDPNTLLLGATVLDNNATVAGTLDACVLGAYVWFTTVRNSATDTIRVMQWDGTSGAVIQDVGVAEASAVGAVFIYGDPQTSNLHTLAYRSAGPDARLRMRRTSDLASLASLTITPNTANAVPHGMTSFAKAGTNYLVPVFRKFQATVADATSLEWGSVTFTSSAYGTYTREADVANVVPLSKPAVFSPFSSGTNRVVIALGRSHDFVGTATFVPSSVHRTALLCGLGISRNSAAPFDRGTQPEPLATLLHDGGPITAGFSDIVNTSVNTSEGIAYVGLGIATGVGLRDAHVFGDADGVFRFDAIALRIEGGLASERPVKERIVGALPTAYAGNVAYVGGPSLRFLDGANVGEQVPFFPPDIKIEQVTGSGKTPAGTYSYCATVEWVDTSGRVHRSAPSPTVTLTVDGLSHHTVKVTMTIPGLSMLGGTPSGTWRVNLYRVPQLGSTFYLRYTANLSYASGTTVTITEDDVQNAYDTTGFLTLGFLTDTDLTTVVSSGAFYLPTPSFLYTTGSVLANIPPPAPVALWSHANRLWLVSGQDQREVWFSKEFEVGVSAEFNDSLTLRIEGDGPIRAGASMDDKALLFTEGNVYAVATGGGGPTATNQGAYPTPELVARGVGTHSAYGAVAFPGGVLFLDASGFKLLGRDLTVSDVGKNLLDVTESAGAVYVSTHVPERQQVWFVLHGRSDILVFDYSRGKLRWSRFEVALSSGAPAVRGLAYLPYDSSVAPTPSLVADADVNSSVPGVYVSRPTTTYDQATANGVSAVPRFVPASVTTQWLRPDGLLGDFRAWVAHWMGHTSDGCGVSLTVYRQQDFASVSSTASETRTWSSSNVATAGDPVHRRARLKNQKGRAFKLKLDMTQDAAAATAAGLVLIGLGLEFGVRSKAAKTGSAVAPTS